MNDSSASITILLGRLADGDPAAEAALIGLVHAELRRMASARLALLGPGQTLQATALVHEAYLKLATGQTLWESRAHFFGAAGRAMRNIIVDQIRRKSAVRHGGEMTRVPLDPEVVGPRAGDLGRVLEIEDALRQLEAEHSRAARVVELRFFVGLNDEQVAEALGLSVRTVYREWSFAKEWLRRALGDDAAFSESAQ